MSKDDYLNTAEFWERKRKEIDEMEKEKRITAKIGPIDASTGTIVINARDIVGSNMFGCKKIVLCKHCKDIKVINNYKEFIIPFALEIYEEDNTYYICLQCLREFMDKELIMDNS